MDMIQTILRAVQLLWIILLTALIGNVIASNINGQESSIDFSMFVIVLTWLAALLGLGAAFASALAIPILLLVGDGLATLFSFIDAIVLSAKLGAVNCSHTAGHGSGWIAYGSRDTEKRCREIQASAVFMWFLCATFCATVFFAFTNFRKGGGSIRSSVPTMSQVRTGV